MLIRQEGFSSNITTRGKHSHAVYIDASPECSRTITVVLPWKPAGHSWRSDTGTSRHRISTHMSPLAGHPCPSSQLSAVRRRSSRGNGTCDGSRSVCRCLPSAARDPSRSPECWIWRPGWTVEIGRGWRTVWGGDRRHCWVHPRWILLPGTGICNSVVEYDAHRDD